MAFLGNHRTGRGSAAAGVLLVAALLILFSVALAAARFRDRDYRADEVNTVHAGVVLNASETAQWIAWQASHPAGWRILGVYWVKLVGVTEGATRWLCALCTMLTLALVYRLGADLFDQRGGVVCAVPAGHCTLCPVLHATSSALTPRWPS